MRAIVSSASHGIYNLSVLEFALGTKVDHYIFTDSSSARQLLTRDLYLCFRRQLRTSTFVLDEGCTDFDFDEGLRPPPPLISTTVAA